MIVAVLAYFERIQRHVTIARRVPPDFNYSKPLIFTSLDSLN